MGDILKKITELLDEGADFEQVRSTGIIIRSNVHWFDSDSEESNGSGITKSNPVQADGVGDIEEGKPSEMSEVDDQTKWLMFINQK